MSSNRFSAIQPWFNACGWQPFPFQEEVWSAYLNGESGLIHAPTGTGKTLAAYLGPVLEAIEQQQISKSAPHQLLWITPLRALAADTVASLQEPLETLGVQWQIETRTGDTKQSTKNKQRHRLPPVLVTTPESLCLLLTRPDGQELLSSLKAVIVDEWHELLASKRGVQTELALARLRHWNPQLRTWGLSATLGNLDVALEALLGVGNPGRIVRGVLPKQTVIDSIIPPTLERFPWSGHLGLTLLPQVLEQIERSRSCLVFTNTRSQTEIWYQEILKAKPEWAGIIALHHGSLDRTVREFVEGALADGKLKCVVCTSSLDLGVDFSPVDRVLQIGSPKGVGRLLQRAGRSGHQPGGVSRVTFVPTNALELIEVAAAREAALIGNIEAREPVGQPLDVLAQHLVTVAMGGGFTPEELLAEVRTTRAYRDLTDTEFQWVVDFVVRGGEALHAYAEYRKVELVDGRYVVTNARVARQHRMSLGTIISEASAQVRFMKGGRLGTVEESFAAKLKKGDCFLFAGRMLEFVRFHELTVWVRLAKKVGSAVPRWQGSRMPLSTELSAAVRDLLEEARQGNHVQPEMKAVEPILALQAKRSLLPKPGEILIERMTSRDGFHVFVYPFEGRLVHEGLVALISYRLTRLQPLSLTMAINDYGFEILSPTAIPFEFALENDLFSPEYLADDILNSLNATELARRQFREIARVAGLVFTGMPGANKSAKQLQVSTGLLYNVFQEYNPTNLLLHQARREVLERQLEHQRLLRTLQRISQSTFRIVELQKPTPLGFPLMVERIRESLSSEKLADRVKRMTLELERD